ncbi:uncharacterized protein A4U43_C10F2070 [Asparagus officinalis]|uniref:Sulfotransferase n=1 Tax=Asparagus officinalis TaxID=4686 RepID=A0A5P1E4D8_ASPOF|nr:uncharacterized protein A4U43_C10F2070 [Asparagus officinalis]
MATLLPPYKSCFPPRTKQELAPRSSVYRSLRPPHLHPPLLHPDPRCPSPLFDGFWFPNGSSFGLSVLHGTLAGPRPLPPRPGDCPPSPPSDEVAHTWLKALAFATLHRSDPARQSLLSPSPPPMRPVPRSTQLYAQRPHPRPRRPPLPAASATHIPYSLLPPPSCSPRALCKIVYSAGNPCDTLVSMWKFANSLVAGLLRAAPLGEFARCSCPGSTRRGRSGDNVIEYWDASRGAPGRVMFMRYEGPEEVAGGGA